MRRSAPVALLALVLAAAGSAEAQPLPANEPTDRVRASDFTCSELGALVTRRGALVVRTGPYGYDRLVRDQQFCERDLLTGPITVETRDDRACFAGYRCRERNYGEGRPD